MQRKKDKQSYTKFCIKFNDITDADIIDALWGVENKTEYIRQLIRDDLTSGGNIKLFGGCE